jgi:hypothetical protein
MTGVQTLGTWWRWPLMPIASLLGATIASGLLNVVVFFGFMILSGRQPDGWFLLYVVPLLSYGIFGYVVALVAILLSTTTQAICRPDNDCRHVGAYGTSAYGNLFFTRSTASISHAPCCRHPNFRDTGGSRAGAHAQGLA